jgi:hypothetical protein
METLNLESILLDTKSVIIGNTLVLLLLLLLF